MSSPDSVSRVWLWYAIATTVLWGFWGAFTGLSAQRGFPDTLVYCVWALTMIPPALLALARTGWKLERDTRSVAYGLVIGFLGAGGQMILFYTLTKGPAYLIFPVISLSPVVTIALSYLLLRERTTWIGAIGIALALIALPLFDFSPEGRFASEGMAWLLPSAIIMVCWGVQAYFMKVANRSMSAESIFFYMMLTGLILGPVAWAMTDFGQPINWSLDGPYLAADHPVTQRRRCAAAGLRLPLRKGPGRLAADERGRAVDDRGHFTARDRRRARTPETHCTRTCADRGPAPVARGRRADRTRAAAMNAILERMARNRSGGDRGIYSVCSAHPIAIEAALIHALRNGESMACIEATSNQVNQDGGYTGMQPAGFRDFVYGIADGVGIARSRVVLGGDHLGPNPWQDRPAEAAMSAAETMVSAYVAAGFRKIHLDCSMPCADDKGPLHDETIARRSAELCAAAERAWSRAGGEPPVYVIGTEVPVPGGAAQDLHELDVTTPASVRATIDKHREIFAEAGLREAWSRVIAAVVQPGVEFTNSSVIDYDARKTGVLSHALDDYPGMVFEAHSTDYQTPAALAQLVRDHFAILKVGPGRHLRRSRSALGARCDRKGLDRRQPRVAFARNRDRAHEGRSTTLVEVLHVGRSRA